MHKTLNGLDVLVCEGRADIFDRIARALEQTGARAIRAEGLPVLMQEGLDRHCLAVASVSAVHIDDNVLVVRRTRGRPVVWIADALGAQAPVILQSGHLLPFDFTPAELCGMLALLAQKTRVQTAPPAPSGAALRGHVHGSSAMNWSACASRPPRMDLNTRAGNPAGN
jgi:hypothetical protein